MCIPPHLLKRKSAPDLPTTMAGRRRSLRLKQWVPPDAAAREAAVGAMLPEHAGLRAAVAGLVAGDLVAPLRKPRASDWLMQPYGVPDQGGETFDQ